LRNLNPRRGKIFTLVFHLAFALPGDITALRARMPRAAGHIPLFGLSVAFTNPASCEVGCVYRRAAGDAWREVLASALQLEL
jgi:hypothetical protein